MEELEAIDWHNQRADACKDEELKAILEHNRDEEKEHASMMLGFRTPREVYTDLVEKHRAARLGGSTQSVALQA